LTQEERLAQAKITEEENKMSLKRIVEAEEERGRKRREKLEALRRRRFDEPILRFISKRGSLIEEIPDEGEYEIVVDDVETGVTKEEAGQSIKQEPLESEHLRETTKEVADNLGEKTDGKEPSGVEGDKIAMDGLPTGQTQIDQESKESAAQPVIAREFSETAKSQQPLSANDTSASLLDEQMDVDHVELSAETIIQPDMGTKSTIIPNATALVDPKTTAHANSTESESAKTAEETTPLGIDPTPQETTTENIASSGFEETQPTTQPSSTNLQPSPQRPPVPPRTPPPYHEAHFTSNTLTYIPLPTQPSLPPTARETFFPNLPLIPPAKPKPSAKCPITGLPARYKDPLSGVGYYDIHAFKILREVGRTGGRYIWCSEGGWFVGEMGWGGRGAKGVPEGWNGLASERKVVGT
jgi:vacuolar protein sorting-associated protein 72